MPYTYEELSKKLDALPEDLKEAVFGEDVSLTLQNIGKKYSLHVDKLGELVNETGLVLVGLSHPKDFIINVAKRLGVDKETARKIAEDVNQQIFQRVRESLKQIHGIEDGKKEQPAPTPTNPVRSHHAEGTATTASGRSASNGTRPEPMEAPKKELRPLEIRPITPFGGSPEPLPPVPPEKKPEINPVRSRPADPDRNFVSDGASGTATTASGRSASNGIKKETAAATEIASQEKIQPPPDLPSKEGVASFEPAREIKPAAHTPPPPIAPEPSSPAPIPARAPITPELPKSEPQKTANISENLKKDFKELPKISKRNDPYREMPE